MRVNGVTNVLHPASYILLFNFSRQGVMRHEKSLGDIVGGYPGDGTRLSRRESARAEPGDIIIRYERVYEAANHSRVHISNGSTPRYSV